MSNTTEKKVETKEELKEEQKEGKKEKKEPEVEEEEEEEEQEDDGEEVKTTRVYVGNLSWNTTWQSLKDHMRTAGNVVYADVFRDEYRRSKGCGVVEYETVEETKKAIKELTDSSLDNRKIFVREDREEKGWRPQGSRGSYRGGRGRGGFRGRGRGRGGFRGRGGYKKYSYNNNNDDEEEDSEPSENAGKQIFVGNLSFDTSEESLVEAFSQCGKIVKAEIKKDRIGRSKGVATILYQTKEEAVKAIKTFHDTELDGRALNVHEDQYA